MRERYRDREYYVLHKIQRTSKQKRIIQTNKPTKKKKESETKSRRRKERGKEK